MSSNGGGKRGPPEKTYKEKYENAANSLHNVRRANATLKNKIESLKKKHHKEQAELLTKMETILNEKDEIQDHLKNLRKLTM